MILKLDSKRIQLARQAEKTVHVRFRMYKAKKRWLIAGAALLFIPAFFQPGHEVKADTSLPQTQVTATSQAAGASDISKCGELVIKRTNIKQCCECY
ncbi:hypothetical protein Lpp126_10598 [Lacticaseibacillus paracasei subsp. paracasei Lpp126]|uniref:Uncharacterized protein n=1 Tax=Lacticaseibacillus paracasei subsp. paracasei Lpp126 TaxID=1256206 RepID=S2RTC3_LACPA|nr:hypothetical protein Lpp126_10598 [Lacticaseibacillus paracasei subsp. paracasei Lpp126]